MGHDSERWVCPTKELHYQLVSLVIRSVVANLNASRRKFKVTFSTPGIGVLSLKRALLQCRCKLIIASFTNPYTYKSWFSHPLLACITTAVGPHFESECSQWSEPWLSCDDSGSGRTIHKPFTMETTVIIEMNFIFSDISRISSVGRRVPVQCHRRFACIHSSC